MRTYKKRLINSIQRWLKKAKYHGWWWDWHLVKLKLYIWWLERKSRKLKRKYCSNNYHRLRSSYISHKKGKKRAQNVYFLECEICKYKFFVSDNDKKKYIKLESGHESIMQSMIENLVKEGIKDDRVRLNEKSKGLRKPKSDGKRKME